MSLQGVCIDTGGAAVLVQDKKYFLFPNGTTHFYVSKFPNPGAHFGCFQDKLFQVVVEEEWPEEPMEIEIELVKDKIYSAELIWRMKGYQGKKLGIYYLKPGRTHADFYFDKQLKKHGGCFPLHWFKDFVEIEQEQEHVTDVSEEKASVHPHVSEDSGEFEQLSLF